METSLQGNMDHRQTVHIQSYAKLSLRSNSFAVFHLGQYFQMGIK
ncbi:MULTISPECIES: hypothetical protein [Paenibacillus]|nr:hypothetical protein [Paenibacillus jamilae]